MLRLVIANVHCGRVVGAAMQNSTSWILNNLASLYWRVQGRSDLAVDCVLAAYYLAPVNAKVFANTTYYFVFICVIIRDVQNRFFYFGSVSVRFLKNSALVRNEFGSVRFKKRGLVRLL